MTKEEYRAFLCKQCINGMVGNCSFELAFKPCNLGRTINDFARYTFKNVGWIDLPSYKGLGISEEEIKVAEEEKTCYYE